MISDDSECYLHYYPDLMKKYQVSRFRMSNKTTISKDADFISLAHVDYDNSSQTPDIYAAIDLAGNTFLTIFCEIQGDLSKRFLATDAESGIKTLMDPKLKYTVTGGIGTTCYYFAFRCSIGVDVNVGFREPQL